MTRPAGEAGNVTLVTIGVAWAFLLFSLVLVADLAGVVSARRQAQTGADAAALAAQRLWQQAADDLAREAPPSTGQDAACIALAALRRHSEQIAQGATDYAAANGAGAPQQTPFLLLESWHDQVALRVTVTQPLHLARWDELLDEAHRTVTARAHAYLERVDGVDIDWDAPCAWHSDFDQN